MWVRLDSHGEASAAAEEKSDAASAMPSPSEVLAAATLEKRKRILGIRGSTVDPILAATQTLSQSASSLSSSSFVLSDDGSSSFDSVSGAMSARVLYPPSPSLRFQIPSDFSDKVAREIFSIMRVMVASDDPNQLCLPQPMSNGGASRGAKGRPREPCTEIQAIETLLSHRFDTGEFHLRSIPPLCVRNELAVLATLRTAALAALAQFETTSEEDDALLEADTKAAAEEAARDAASADSALSAPRVRPPGRLTSTQRNCVIMRRGEKEVLEHYLALGAEALFVVKSFRACRVVAANSAATAAGGPRPSAWQLFMQTVVDPRYSSGEGPFDYYLTSVILPLLQQEEEQKATAEQAAAQQHHHVHSESCAH